MSVVLDVSLPNISLPAVSLPYIFYEDISKPNITKHTKHIPTRLGTDLTKAEHTNHLLENHHQTHKKSFIFALLTRHYSVTALNQRYPAGNKVAHRVGVMQLVVR